MDASNLTLEIGQVITVIISVGGLLKIHFSMEKKMALQDKEIEYLKAECSSVKNDFDSLENEVRQNKEDFSNQYNELGKEIGKVHTKIESTKLEIIQEIHKLTKSK